MSCDLIWHADETYANAVRRARELADSQGRVVVVIDAPSGKVVKRVTPARGYFDL